MITQAVILLLILTTVPLLARPAGFSRRHSSGNKILLDRIYIRESFYVHINSLAKKYSYLIGNFDLKLPILMGSFKSKTPSIWVRIKESKLMAQTTTTIRHDDTKGVVYKIKKNCLINKFSMVGRFNTNYSENTNPNNIDIVDLMNNLPPKAINLFKMIKDNNYYETNEATLERPKGKYEQKKRCTRHLFS